MRKAFTQEDNGEDPEERDEPDPLPAHIVNYMTPTGFAQLMNERQWLHRTERPRICEIVSWAASLGDRSENADYHFNKKRLREIDRRLRYLTKRLESAEVVDPKRQQHLEQVFFGATVTYLQSNGCERTVTLVGVDEADLDAGKINWISPVGKALFKAREGDVVELRQSGGIDRLEIITIEYIIRAEI